MSRCNTNEENSVQSFILESGNCNNGGSKLDRLCGLVVRVSG